MGTLANVKTQMKCRKVPIFGESITCDPLKYTMEHSDLIVSIFMGKSIGIKRVKLFTS